MRIRLRKKIPPLNMMPGDTISLRSRTEMVGDDGKVVMAEEKEVLKSTIDKEASYDQAVIFDVEPGDFKGAKGGIGGAFLEAGE